MGIKPPALQFHENPYMVIVMNPALRDKLRDKAISKAPIGGTRRLPRRARNDRKCDFLRAIDIEQIWSSNSQKIDRHILT